MQRLAQRKQATPVLSSEQRELQEIERRRLAAAAERSRSHDYWQRTKRAGAAPVTPPRAFLQKPAAAAAQLPTPTSAARTAANGSQQSARPQSASGARAQQLAAFARASTDMTDVSRAKTPSAAVLSPFGTTTPPMQPAASPGPAQGGSATFAGFLLPRAPASETARLVAAQPSAATPGQWGLPAPSGLLPTPPPTSKTPVLWGSHLVADAACSHAVPGDAEVHLESTRTGGIRLSSGPTARNSDSEEVSASLTPRVPASFLQSRAPALTRGPLCPLGVRGAHVAAQISGHVAGAPKRGNAGRSDEGRHGSLDCALMASAPSHAGSPRRTRRVSPSQGLVASAHARTGPTSARSLPQKIRNTVRTATGDGLKHLRIYVVLITLLHAFGLQNAGFELTWEAFAFFSKHFFWDRWHSRAFAAKGLTWQASA